MKKYISGGEDFISIQGEFVECRCRIVVLVNGGEVNAVGRC